MSLKRKISRARDGVRGYLSEKKADKKRLAFLVVVLLGMLSFSNLIRSSAESYALMHLRFNDYQELSQLRNRVLAMKYEQAKPFLIRKAEEPDIQAKGAVMVLVKNNEERVLYEKEADKPFPIASLTKLMSALVVLENYDLNQKIVFSEEAARKEGEPNFFKTGERFYVRDLLYSSLVESSNRAVFALAEVMGEEKFVQEMNRKARELGMENTQFFKTTGLDPDLPQEDPNHSTANDLVKLARELSKKEIIGSISRTKSRSLYTASGWFHHEMQTTNKMLEEIPGLVMAKTGHTPQAGHCLLIAYRNQHDNNLIIGVVLGAEDNFREMKKMMEWVDNSYKW